MRMSVKFSTQLWENQNYPRYWIPLQVTATQKNPSALKRCSISRMTNLNRPEIKSLNNLRKFHQNFRMLSMKKKVGSNSQILMSNL